MKIFITRPIPQIGIKMLRDKGYEVVVNEKAENRPAEKEEILNALRPASPKLQRGEPAQDKGGVDALLSLLTDKIDAEIMDAGLPTLKIIANYAVGFDNIDIKAAKQKNIMIANTPGVLTETVAEHTFALMLSIAHRIAEADKFTRAGLYKTWGALLLLGTDVSKKTLGIVGLGRIGSRVAFHAVKGFNMKVLYTDIKQNQEFEDEFGAQYYQNLDEMLPECDFVSVHVPLLESTRHLINEERLRKMKPSAYLINTSRGPVVDEKALAKALKEEWIKGAAIDVFEFEPKVTPELLRLNNIILTPHIASATEETRNKMAELAAKNIIEALEGREPPNLIK